MFCKNCGSKIDDDAQFCMYCGTIINKPNYAQNADSEMSIADMPIIYPGQDDEDKIVDESPIKPPVQNPAPVEQIVEQPVAPTPVEQKVEQSVAPTPAPVEQKVEQPVVPTPAPVEQKVEQPVAPVVQADNANNGNKAPNKNKTIIIVIGVIVTVLLVAIIGALISHSNSNTDSTADATVTSATTSNTNTTSATNLDEYPTLDGEQIVLNEDTPKDLTDSGWESTEPGYEPFDTEPYDGGYFVSNFKKNGVLIADVSVPNDTDMILNTDDCLIDYYEVVIDPKASMYSDKDMYNFDGITIDTSKIELPYGLTTDMDMDEVVAALDKSGISNEKSDYDSDLGYAFIVINPNNTIEETICFSKDEKVMQSFSVSLI